MSQHIGTIETSALDMRLQVMHPTYPAASPTPPAVIPNRLVSVSAAEPSHMLGLSCADVW
jgi:hypothetical protein